MVTSAPDRGGGFSTGPSRAPRAADNRGMTAETDQPGVPGTGRFLTLADTAEVLNISAPEAHALVRSGELPAIQIGDRGVWRVERDVLEGFIEARYEETRRRALWQQAQFADVPDLFAPPRDS